MQKKVLISLGFIAMLGLTTSQVMAHSTIYTDDIGRMHFLGKDPGAKTLQKVEDFDNPATKDVTNAVYDASKVESSELNESNVSATTEGKAEEIAPVEEKKSRGFFTGRKESSPYSFGNSSLNDASKFKETDQKTFWLW